MIINKRFHCFVGSYCISDFLTRRFGSWFLRIMAAISLSYHYYLSSLSLITVIGNTFITVIFTPTPARNLPTQSSVRPENCLDVYLSVNNKSKNYFISVGTGNNYTSDYSSRSFIWKFDKSTKNFTEFQKISTTGAWDWTYFSIKGEGQEKYHFLVVANTINNNKEVVQSSRVYYWSKQGPGGTGNFYPYQEINVSWHVRLLIVAMRINWNVSSSMKFVSWFSLIAVAFLSS